MGPVVMTTDAAEDVGGGALSTLAGESIPGWSI